MPSFKSIIAIAAALSAVSASPINIARQSNPATVPNASHDSPMNGIPSAGQAPLAEPSNIGSLDACLAACQSNPSCVSYVFNNDVCKLYAAPSNNKRQSNPATVPNASHDSPQNGIPQVGQSPLAEPSGVDSLAACLASCQDNPSCVSYVFSNNVCKLYAAPSNNKRQNNPATVPQATHSDPMNGIPAQGQSPLAEPSVTSLDACLAACEGNPSCVSYVFSNNVCKLYASPSNNKRSAAPVAVVAVQEAKRQDNPATVPQATHANPMNGIPAANQAPLATPSNIGSLDACLAACQENPSCVSYVFASNVCKLYA